MPEFPSWSSRGTRPLTGCIVKCSYYKEQTVTWWVFEDERAEFVSGVKHAAVSTGLTGSADGLFLGVDILWKEIQHNVHK